MEERIKKIIEHYEHAKEKHPFFADSIMDPRPLRIDADGAWARNWIKRHNEMTKRLWRDRAKQYKDCIKMIPSFENIINAEIYEIYAAVTEDNLEQAHYEIFDAIAVLLRLDEEMDGLCAKRPKAEVQA